MSRPGLGPKANGSGQPPPWSRYQSDKNSNEATKPRSRSQSQEGRPPDLDSGILPRGSDTWAVLKSEQGWGRDQGHAREGALRRRPQSQESSGSPEAEGSSPKLASGTCARACVRPSSGWEQSGQGTPGRHCSRGSAGRPLRSGVQSGFPSLPLAPQGFYTPSCCLNLPHCPKSYRPKQE